MTTTVTEDLDLPSGASPRGITVTVFLAGEGGKPLPAGYATVAGKTFVGQHQFNPALDGSWSLTLQPNADISPSGTVWGVKLSGPGSSGVSTTPRFGLVPGSGPVTFESILTDPPGALTPSALAAHEAQRGPGAHLPDGDPNDGDTILWDEAGQVFTYGPGGGGGGGAVASVNHLTGAVLVGALLRSETAGTALSGHVLVSPRSDGTVIAADPTSLAGIDAPIWLTTAAASNAAPVEVLLAGRFTEPSWSWTPNAPLYLGAAGAITATVPTAAGGAAWLRKVATALTATVIQFNPSPPIKLT